MKYVILNIPVNLTEVGSFCYVAHLQRRTKLLIDRSNELNVYTVVFRRTEKSIILSILLTLICPILGLPALIFSVRARLLQLDGHVIEARNERELALRLLVLAGVSTFCLCLFIGLATFFVVSRMGSNRDGALACQPPDHTPPSLPQFNDSFPLFRREIMNLLEVRFNQTLILQSDLATDKDSVDEFRKVRQINKNSSLATNSVTAKNFTELIEHGHPEIMLSNELMLANEIAGRANEIVGRASYKVFRDGPRQDSTPTKISTIF